MKNVNKNNSLYKENDLDEEINNGILKNDDRNDVI